MHLQRVGLKFFVQNPSSLSIEEFVPVFHGWIQTRALDDLLIDVADYKHVQTGPGIVLVAHEANYSMDQAQNRLGLLYYRKQPVTGDFGAVLQVAFRSALKACARLEEEPKLKERLKFRGDEFVFLSNDRLLGPNTEESFLAIRPILADLLSKLFGHQRFTMTRNAEPKERLMITVQTPEAFCVQALSRKF